MTRTLALQHDHIGAAIQLAQRDDVDVFVELIGGEDGPAKAATEAAIKAGKDVVTANKAMLAMHGQDLAELAEKHNKIIRFEAAVAGGIPVIKALTEGLAGNTVTRVMGVMNGSCNYILTRMQSAGLTYEEVFAEADGLGYLEADPQLDVGGIDAAHKLAILSAIAFGTQVNFDGIAGPAGWRHQYDRAGGRPCRPDRAAWCWCGRRAHGFRRLV